MATFKLKNNSTESGVVPGVGEFVNGVLNNAPEDFENPNFVKVSESEQPVENSTTPQPSTPAPALPNTPPPAAPAPSAPVTAAQPAPVAPPASQPTPTAQGGLN